MKNESHMGIHAYENIYESAIAFILPWFFGFCLFKTSGVRAEETEEQEQQERTRRRDSPTPYSINSLFSEFFKQFSGVILGVCETIWRLFGGSF